ncbi:MAG: V4R domain-containing protein [Streptosporangiaceae bacterium]
MATTTVTNNTTTAMELPVCYVAPGQPLAEVIVNLDGWEYFAGTVHALAGNSAQPRLAYAYQLPGSSRLLAKLVVNVTAAEAGEASLSTVLSAVRGLQVISIQPPTEAGLVMSERQRPELAGTPAAIFGRPIIGGLARGIIEAQGEAGERFLAQLGRDAGHLAASALPPLIEQLGMTISDDLLTRRMRDLQVMGWATFERASIKDSSYGEAVLSDTFEAAPWNQEAASPTCHFLSGFIAGVFSFVWAHPVTCRELECQATGAATCRFAFQIS